MNWTARELEKAQGREKGTTKRTVAPRPASATPKQNGAPVAPVISLPLPTVGTYPGPCSWILAHGRVTASLPKVNDPDRHRLVLHLPADAALVGAVLQAVEKYCEPV